MKQCLHNNTLIETDRMATFLDNHCKIHQLESRLKRNQYLSNECLPNSIDAKVFKALKSSNQIPKRQVYPYFYHWYILMRQFADRTLDHWLKNSPSSQQPDQTISEVVKLLSKKNQQQTPTKSQQTSQQPQNNIQLSSQTDVQSLQQKAKHKDSIQSLKQENQLTKTTSQIEKKHSNHENSVIEYLMSIKLNANLEKAFENVKKIFQVQNVKIQSIKISNEVSTQMMNLQVRVYYETSAIVCEQLKNQILRCSNVESIQCKKQRRNQSL